MVSRHEAGPLRMAEQANRSLFETKFLDESSLPDLLRLQEVIAANLPCPEVFMLHDERYFPEIFRHERSAIGAMVGDELIAYSIIRIPGLAGDNLGRDLNLPEDELTGVCHLQAIAVHPTFRGNGLQRKLAAAHLHVIEEMGCKHVCCTVSPKNPVSLANILSCGLVIKGMRPKLHGWCRYILHKNISSPVGRAEAAGPGAYKKEIRICSDDIKGQIDLLKRGYEGFKTAFDSEGIIVFYGKN
jgi:GNAT superfamily N-acetyltransferase